MPGKFAATLAALAPTGVGAPAEGVRLWWRSLAANAAERESLASLLSDAEHARASRFGRPELRDRYIVGRGTLRVLLGIELGIEPGAVVIVRGERGRPRVESPAIELDFNVSHTAGCAMFALARRRRVGIDIERDDREINAQGIARKFLAPTERAVLDGHDADRARRQILRLWTCKEAMSKATGDALSAPFSRIEVALEPVLAVIAGPAPYAPARWQLYSADVPAGFLGTLALWDRPST